MGLPAAYRSPFDLGASLQHRLLRAGQGADERLAGFAREIALMVHNVIRTPNQPEEVRQAAVLLQVILSVCMTVAVAGMRSVSRLWRGPGGG